MLSLLQIVLVGVVGVLTAIYYIGRYNESYWKKRGVVFWKKHKTFGVNWDFITHDRPYFQHLLKIYKEYPNEPAVGIGSFMSPLLYVRDPENIQHVLQTDFQNFNHRGLSINKNDVLADNILFMHGVRWKLMRQNMSPLFTASKLKNMYYIIEKSALDFVDFLNTNPDKKKGNAYLSLTYYCNAALSAAVFGIGTESTFESPFHKMAVEAFKPTVKAITKFTLASLSNRLFLSLGLTLFGEHEKFFIGAIKKVVRAREKENTTKHDFIDLCVNLQKNGIMKDQNTGFQLKPTDELLAGQAFFYYLAGVDPCATATFSTLFEVSRHPEIEKKLLEEIDEVCRKYNGNLCYDAIAEMKYLDKVLNESLRMYPPIAYLTRQCLGDTVLPKGNIKVEKGTKITTSLYEIHHDPKYYPNPEVFDPERFNDFDRNDIRFMPFGKGGRLCIGMRYATLQVKVGLVHILRNFKVISKGGKLDFSKETLQLRLKNVDLEFVSLKS